ncbi:MAG: ABC transporter substrate-binding protein [Alphaproteobacteria bacterium]
MQSIKSALFTVLFVGAAALNTAHAQTAQIPVLVPLTGFLSLEGTSQRNGAALALEEAAARGLAIEFDVSDTGTDPATAINAFIRATGQDNVVAMVAPMLGTQMLALLPLAEEFSLPLITVSGTAKITQLGNPFVFRYFPGDTVVKRAHARYAVEELGIKRPAIIFQTTAYGQSGRAHLAENLTTLGSPPVFEEALDVSVKDMLPTLTKARQAGADALLLHLHAGPTALVIRQAAEMGLNLPIVAGSAMHQPSTAALLEPRELAGVCAESGSSPISGGSPEIADFAQRYQAKFDVPPDAFALGQYDGVSMVLAAIEAGATGPAAIRESLATTPYRGLAMTYKSDGTGNMAHDAVIICYNGRDHLPRIVQRYAGSP